LFLKFTFLEELKASFKTTDRVMKILFQITTYHAKPDSKVVKKELLKLKGPSVIRGGTGTWSGDSIQIPSGVVPTRLAGRSTLISIDYSIEVK
jgi:hypothetical protein